MSRQRSMFVALLTIFFVIPGPGCAFNTHGNRRAEEKIVTRFPELRGKVGKRVTLVGTARDGALDLRGGTVELPGYQWPDGFIGQPVHVSGTLFDAPREDKRAPRAYRLGEIEGASRWSR